MTEEWLKAAPRAGQASGYRLPALEGGPHVCNPARFGDILRCHGALSSRHTWSLCTGTARPGDLFGPVVTWWLCAGGQLGPPHVCGKSPKDLAFAVPMWARGLNQLSA